MTVQRANFLNMTSNSRLRGAGAQYRRDMMETSILQSAMFKNKRVPLRTGREIDYSKLYEQYNNFYQENNDNNSKWTKSEKRGAIWGGIIGTLITGGPIGTFLGALIGKNHNSNGKS